MSSSDDYDYEGSFRRRFDNELNANDPMRKIRKRAGMYFGHEDNVWEFIVKELVANAIDQHLAGHATFVEVSVDGDEVTVSDDGAGMVFDDASAPEHSTAMLCLTRPHHSATADGHAPHVHLSGYGVGLAPIVAVCARFALTTWRDGVRWDVRFREGVLDGGVTSSPDTGGVGTSITLEVSGVPWGGRVAPQPVNARDAILRASRLFPSLPFVFDGARIQSPEGSPVSRDRSSSTCRGASAPGMSSCASASDSQASTPTSTSSSAATRGRHTMERSGSRARG